MNFNVVYLVFLLIVVPLLVTTHVLRDKLYKWTAIVDMLFSPLFLFLTAYAIYSKQFFGITLLLWLMTLIALMGIREGRIKLRLIRENKPLIGKWFL